MRQHVGFGGWILVGVTVAAIVGCGKVPASSPDGGTGDADLGCMANAFSCGADDALYQCDANGVAKTKVEDCQYGCTNDRCNECAANTTFCNADDLVQCDSSGTIVNPQACAFGCQMNRCNTCEPNAKYCDSGNAVTCGANGEPASTMNCGTAGCLGGVCNTCTPNTTTCQGDTLVVCNGQGTVQSTTNCTLGCGSTPNAHCKALVPSYGVGVPSGSLPSLVIDADATLDISNCAALNVLLTKGGQTAAVPTAQLVNVVQSGGPPICVVRYGSITVMNGYTLTVTNDEGSGHALSLQAVGDLQIAGSVYFRNAASGPAPGANVSVVGGDNNKSPGPGGGGAARAGGSGGSCLDCSGTTDFPGGTGGAAVTTISNRLSGGSSGGDATTTNGIAGYGGLGGGGLQLVSTSRVIVAATGRIDLNANPGFSSQGMFAVCPVRATGGGGSGGTLVAEAPTVSLSAGAIIAANGAGGGGGCYENGQFGCFGKSGQGGQLGTSRAAGGDCTYAGTVGDGGWEANGTTTPPINGYDSDIGAANVAGGGGGGSSGFIFLRARTQGDVVFPGTSIVSPLPTIQAVTAN